MLPANLIYLRKKEKARFLIPKINLIYKSLLEVDNLILIFLYF